MNKTLIILLIGIWGAACSALPNALDESNNAQDALVFEHKMALEDSIAAKKQADIDYYASSEYQQGRHANQFIKNNRGGL